MALAETEYIKVLIDVIVLRIDDIKKKWGMGGTDQNPLGDPFYQFSGGCIILRDGDADGEKDDNIYEACAVTSAELARLLYGNVAAHLMREYINRLSFVLESQVVEE